MAGSIGAPSAPLSPGGAHDHVDLATVFSILRRRWLVVVLSLLAFLGLAVAYAAVTPKIWRSSARVLLDPRDKQIVGNEMGRPQQSVETGWVETRVELVKAYGTLAAVVQAEKLTEDEDILSPKEAAAAADKTTAAVRNLAEMLIVERPKENNLVDVTIGARSPEKAARLANAVARAFVEGLAQAKVEQLEHANDLLNKQIDEMRRQMQEAEAKVEDYKRSNGIAVTRGNLVDEETLRQSNESLVSARIKTQETRERYERLRQVLKTGDPTIASQNDSIGSAVLSRLKIESAIAARRKNEIEQNYGPRHPRVIAAAAEVERAKAQVVDEIKSLAATAELDWQIARANEDNIRKAVERAQSRLADTSQAVVGLQELENDATAKRDLYKSFVSRLEETKIQKTTQISDARLVSPAQVPLRPFSPRLSLALGLAAVAGLGVGLSLALWLGRGDAAALRAAARPPLVEPPAPAPLAAVAPSEPASAAPPVAAAEPEPPAPAPAPLAPSPTVAAVAPQPVVARVRPPRASAPADPAPVVAAAPVVAPAPAAVPAPAAALAGPRPDGVDDLARADFVLAPDRIARLGAAGGPGNGPTAALIETAEGRRDDDALDAFATLATDLGALDRGVRAVFSNTVPTLVTAALAHGLAVEPFDAGRDVLLLDLAREDEPLDAAFLAADLVDETGDAAEDAFELVEDVDGFRLARPIDPIAAGDDAAPRDLAGFLARARGTHDLVVVHLGCAPAAALLFAVAGLADRVDLVVDRSDLDQRRTRDEIEVMIDLMPRLDGLVVLATDDDDRSVDHPPARRVGT